MATAINARQPRVTKSTPKTKKAAPRVAAKPRVKPKAPSVILPACVLGIVAYLVCSLIAFSFLEVARRDAKMWTKRAAVADLEGRRLEREVQQVDMRLAAIDLGFETELPVPKTQVVAAEKPVQVAQVVR